MTIEKQKGLTYITLKTPNLLVNENDVIHVHETIVIELVSEIQMNVILVIETLIVNYVKRIPNFVVLDLVVLDLLNYKLDAKIIHQKFTVDIILIETLFHLQTHSKSNRDVPIVIDL